MRRQRVKLEGGNVVERGYFMHARQVRHDSAAAQVKKDVRRRQHFVSDLHFCRRQEADMGTKQRAALHARHPGFDALARALGDRLLALLDGRKVNADFSPNARCRAT